MDHLFRDESTDSVCRQPNELTLCIFQNHILDDSQNVDDSDCSRYLARRGWDLDALLRGQWRSAHPINGSLTSEQCFVRCLGALQGWFTFGFLQACVFLEYLAPEEPPVRILARVSRASVVAGLLPPSLSMRLFEAATSADTTQVFVFDTSNLIHFLSCYRGLMFAHDVADQNLRDYQRKLPRSCLRAMNEFQNAHMRLTTTAFRESLDVKLNNDKKGETEIALGWLFAMPALLSPTVSLFLSGAPGMQATFHTFDPLSLGKLLRQPLIQKHHWCPATLNILQVRVNLPTLAWMWARNLRSTLLTADHAQCETTCAAYNIKDEESLPLRHECVQLREQCPKIRPDMQQLAAILNARKTPVMRFNGDELEVVPSGKVLDRHYVAFSHVWHQGRGSCSEMGLFACQLEFLQKTATDAASLNGQTRGDKQNDAHFWIDSLCIPKNRELRRRAIEAMSDIYMWADSVVVVDEAMRSLSSTTEDCEVLLLHLLASPWMTRVWTWQEGSLARKLWILFADAKLLRLAPDWIEDLAPEHQLGLQETNCPLYHHLKRELALHVFPTSQSLHSLKAIRELQFRQTSKPEDELIAIGALVGVSIYELQKLQSMDERMAYFLQHASEGRLSSQIVFTRGSKVQGVPCFRWAPSSFFSREQPGLGLASADALCTKDGLEASYLALEMTNDFEMQKGTRLIYVRDERSGDEYETCLVYQSDEVASSCKVLLFNLDPELAVGSPEEVVASRFNGKDANGRLILEYLARMHLVRTSGSVLPPTGLLGTISRKAVLLQ